MLLLFLEFLYYLDIFYPNLFNFLYMDLLFLNQFRLELCLQLIYLNLMHLSKLFNNPLILFHKISRLFLNFLLNLLNPFLTTLCFLFESFIHIIFIDISHFLDFKLPFIVILSSMKLQLCNLAFEFFYLFISLHFAD